MIAAVAPAAAGDATWTGQTNNYFSASNWNTNAPPTDTAFFNSAPVTAVQIGSAVSVGGWAFGAAAPVYIFNGSSTVNFAGTGIAGSATVTNNTSFYFLNTSSAGAANITNNGVINFTGSSAAGSGTITSNSTGRTYFLDHATGGTANLAANGAGAVDFSQLASAGTTVGSIQGSGHFFLGSHAVTVGAKNLSTTVSGVIADGGVAGGTGGSLAKVGAGTLTLSGANTYTGGTTVTGGLINFNSVNNFGTGSITLNGGGLQWANGVTTDISSRIAPIGASGTTFDTNGNNVTFSTGLTGTGGLTKTGVGTLTLAAGNGYFGATTINGGTLQAGQANAFSATSATTVNAGGTLDLGGFTQTINAVTLAGGTLSTGELTGTIASMGGTVHTIGGAASLTTTGGLTTLYGSNSYSRVTTINGGALLGTGANTFSAASATTVNAGGALDLGGFTQTINALTLAGGALQNGRLEGSITSTGGTIDGIGGGASLKTIGGLTTLSGSNAYTGATLVGGGTLLGLNANAFSAASATTVNANGTLDLGGLAQSINAVALSGGRLSMASLPGQSRRRAASSIRSEEARA